MLHGAMEGTREILLGCSHTNAHITLGPSVPGSHLHAQVPMKAQRGYRKASSKGGGHRGSTFSEDPNCFAFSIPIVLLIEFDPEGQNSAPLLRRPIRKFLDQ